MEHIGYYAHRGHYISHTMDSDDQWRCFDDQSVQYRDFETIADSVNAYILFYELIQ